eukprot:Filipodium_phascolosomae@DN2354_c0_g1_i4.p1
MQDYKRNSLLLLLLAVVAAVVGVEGLTIRSEGSSSKVSSSKVSSVMSTPLRRSRDALEEHPSDAKYIVIFEPRWQFPDTWDEALKRLEPLKVLLEPEPAKEALFEALDECYKRYEKTALFDSHHLEMIHHVRDQLIAFYLILNGQQYQLDSAEGRLGTMLRILQQEPRDETEEKDDDRIVVYKDRLSLPLNLREFNDATRKLHLPEVEVLELPSEASALRSDRDLQNELRMGWKDVVVELKSLVAKSKTEVSELMKEKPEKPKPEDPDWEPDYLGFRDYLYKEASERERIYNKLAEEKDDVSRELFVEDCQKPSSKICYSLMNIPHRFKPFYLERPYMFKSMLEEANLIQRTWAKSTWDINWIVPPNRK